MAAGFLRELVQAYSKQHPGVDIQIIEGASTEHISLVRKRHLDVAFVADPSEAADCDVAPLWNERLFVVLPRGHALCDRKEVAWQALRNEHFIIRQSNCGRALCERVIKHLSNRGHTPSTQKVDVGRETVMHLVAMGRGVSSHQRSDDRDVISGGGFPSDFWCRCDASIQRRMVASQ